MDVKAKSTFNRLASGAAAALVVSASAGCSNEAMPRFAPVDLGGPIDASIVQNKPESTGIKIEGAQILSSPSDVTLAVQDLHGQDSGQQITVTLVPDNNNHIVVIKSNQPGYLKVLLEDNCPDGFPNPNVVQSEGLAGILTQLGADSNVAENEQTRLMVNQKSGALAYSGSVIKGQYLTSALKNAPGSLVAEFAPDKKYIVHQYRFGCQDANGKSQTGVSETTYNFVTSQALGRQ